MERYSVANLFPSIAWILAVLIGMIGYGRMLARTIGTINSNVGWGIHAVWGMSVFLFIGGVLGAVGQCREIAITLLILGGAIFFIRDVRGEFRTWRTFFQGHSWGIILCGIALVVLFLGGARRVSGINPADDLIAYFTFTEKLMSTGSMEEPFSWRRLASLGGSTLLQCCVLVRTSYASAQAFELAISPVILFGLITGFRGGTLRRSALGCFVCFVAITTPIFRTNTASSHTGLVMLIGLFLTIDLIDKGNRNLRIWLVAGLVGAGICTLRAQFIPAVGMAMGLFWLTQWKHHRWSAVGSAKVLTAWGGALFLALLPWMIQCYVSNDTPLYPLFQGGNSKSFNPQAAQQALPERLWKTGQLLFSSPMLPLLLSPLAWLRVRAEVCTACVWGACVIASALLAFTITLAPDETTVPRYVQPMLLAGGLAAIITRAASGERTWIAWSITIGLFIQNLPSRINHLMEQGTELERSANTRLIASGRLIASHRDAQALIPEGKRVVVCTDAPFLFDHRRNEIWNIDMPHAASPKPGLPFQQPPEETKRYWQKLGVEYLIFGDFSKSQCLYLRRHWETQRTGSVELYRIQAPFYLDFAATAEALAKSETILGQKRVLTVVKLNP